MQVTVLGSRYTITIITAIRIKTLEEVLGTVLKEHELIYKTI